MRIDTPQEWLYYRHGGILQFVLRALLAVRRERRPLTTPPSRRPTWTPTEQESCWRASASASSRSSPALRSDRGGGEAVERRPAHGRRGDRAYEAELDQSLIERLEHDLEAIERAERRLEEGTYGLSVESGEPIPDGRLEAVPWAERTAEEQSRLDARYEPDSRPLSYRKL